MPDRRFDLLPPAAKGIRIAGASANPPTTPRKRIDTRSAFAVSDTKPNTSPALCKCGHTVTRHEMHGWHACMDCGCSEWVSAPVVEPELDDRLPMEKMADLLSASGYGDALMVESEQLAPLTHPIVEGCTHAGPCTDRCEPEQPALPYPQPGEAIRPAGFYDEPEQPTHRGWETCPDLCGCVPDTTTNMPCVYCGDEGATYRHDGRVFCQAYHAAMDEARGYERARIKRLIVDHHNRTNIFGLDGLLAAIDGDDDA